MQTANDVDITLEDQQNLNKFSLLHQKTRQINFELLKYNEAYKKLEECNEELELCDDERVHYVFSSCFISVPLETAVETNQRRLDEAKLKIEELKSMRDQNMVIIDVLKRSLGKKFGDKINLQE